jgi:hypothetical protein
MFCFSLFLAKSLNPRRLSPLPPSLPPSPPPPQGQDLGLP